MLRRAVERELEIIGEAMNKIQKLDKNLKIENQTKIISLRNRVIHAYDSIDNEIVWGVVTRHIPLLNQEIDELLEKYE